MFVGLLREGWIQKLVSSARHPFGQWKVFWLELLQDGKMSWFETAAKRKADFRRAPAPPLVVPPPGPAGCTNLLRARTCTSDHSTTSCATKRNQTLDRITET